MNNLSFGFERMRYYETICGGADAGPGFAGADIVQTRMTDAEALETRYPIIPRGFQFAAVREVPVNIRAVTALLANYSFAQR